MIEKQRKENINKTKEGLFENILKSNKSLKVMFKKRRH